MKIKNTLALMLTLVSGPVIANDLEALVEYVHVCSEFAKGYYLTPGQSASGTYTCNDSNSGLVATTSDGGSTFIYGQSQLLQRITALETQLRILQARLGITPLEQEEE